MAKAESNSPSPGQRVLVIAGSLAAAAAAKKVVSVGWIAATGRKPPEDTTDPKVRNGEAIVFAMVIAAATGAARAIILRRLTAIEQSLSSVSEGDDDQAKV